MNMNEFIICMVSIFKFYFNFYIILNFLLKEYFIFNIIFSILLFIILIIDIIIIFLKSIYFYFYSHYKKFTSKNIMTYI